MALFPAYTEPSVDKPAEGGAQGSKKVTEKLYMYVAQARFVLDKAPSAIDLSHYVTLPFLEKIDPAIKHELITAADVTNFKDEAGTGNDNADRKWCTGRTTSICIQSTYKLEGKIPMGILLVNKLRDSIKKVADHIDFQSEFSALAPADLDPAGPAAIDHARYPDLGRARTGYFLCQRDHEVRQILRRVPGRSDRSRQNRGHRLYGARHQSERARRKARF